MEYRIKTENTFGKSILDVVLENRGLTESDMEELLNPSVENVEFPQQIPNMNDAIKLFINELDMESKIGIIVDSDCDGFTSSALLYQFLINECNYAKDKIELFFHEEKGHGLSDEKLYKKIRKSDVEFLIIPDAGTNDLKEIKELLKMGKRVLTLDHHNQNEDELTIIKDQNGKMIYVLVNNQLGEHSKALSGVGVVWKFLSAMTEDELEHYMDLVAVGNIADMMEIDELELRYIVNKGLENINNGLFKEMLDKETYTPTDVSFNIANKINAVCRYGSMAEKVDTFRALAMFEEERVYKPRKTKNNPNPQEEVQSLQKYMARTVGNVKTRQDNAVKSSMSKVKDYIDENNCLDHKVVLVINEGKGKNSLLAQNIGGLVANKLIDIYKRPIMILHKHEDMYSGSMRGYGVESFKEILESTEIVEVMGHNNSAGIFVKKSDIPRLIKRLDKAMEDVEIEEASGYEVDCELDIDDLVPSVFKQFESMKKIWHTHCKEPMFLIKDIELDKEEIKHPFATLITFKYGGYKFDKNYCSGEFVDKILNVKNEGFGRKVYNCNVIVKLSTNEYNKNGYFEVVDMEVELKKGTTKKKDDKIPF